MRYLNKPTPKIGNVTPPRFIFKVTWKYSCVASVVLLPAATILWQSYWSLIHSNEHLLESS